MVSHLTSEMASHIAFTERGRRHRQRNPDFLLSLASDPSRHDTESEDVGSRIAARAVLHAVFSSGLERRSTGRRDRPKRSCRYGQLESVCTPTALASMRAAAPG